MSHTPGPWRVDHHSSDAIPAIYGPKEAEKRGLSECLCELGWTSEMGDRGGRYPNADANARLIAAAPEMFEALEDLVSMLKNDPMHCWEDDLRPAILAIAKAKGGVEA